MSNSKTVPLVVYLEDGTRKVIGTAEVEDSGDGVNVKGHVTEEEFVKKFEINSRLFSMSVGPSRWENSEVALVEPSPLQKLDDFRVPRFGESDVQPEGT